MRIKNLIIILLSIVLTGCAAGVGSSGLFGTGVSVAMDPRTVGTQIDDSIMQKTISTKILALDKKHFLQVKSKVLDGRIFITGKVDDYFILLAYWFVGFRVSHSIYHIFLNNFISVIPLLSIFIFW